MTRRTASPGRTSASPHTGAIDLRSWWAAVRAPRRAVKELVGDGPVFPLLILFGLNAVDELDRTGFGILLPNIRDAFGMSNTGILSLVAVTAVGALVMQLPIAIAADRGNRISIALAGALLWAGFSVMTGAATAIWMLIVARLGSGIGRAVVDPTHNTLLSDFYSVDRRPAVFSFHRAANVLGQFLGPLLAGVLAYTFTWRAPFFVFAVPTVILVVLGARISDPIRGRQERRAAGASDEVSDTEEQPRASPSRGGCCGRSMCCAASGTPSRSSPSRSSGSSRSPGCSTKRSSTSTSCSRGYLAAVAEPFQFIGLAIGARLGTRLFLRDPALIFRFLPRRCDRLRSVRRRVRARPDDRVRNHRQRVVDLDPCGPAPRAVLDPVARHPRQRAVARLLGRGVVGDPRPGAAPHDRLGQRPVRHPLRHARDGAHPVGRRAADRQRWRRGAPRHLRRVGCVGRPVTRRSWPARTAAPSCSSSTTSTSPTGSSRCSSTSTSRSPRARSSRCSAPTALASPRCCERSRGSPKPTSARSSWTGTRHHPRPTQRDRSARRRAGARRRERVPVAHRGRQPAGRGVDDSPRARPGRRTHRIGPRDVSRSCGPGSRTRLRACPAVSSRCSASGWRCCPGPRLLLIDELSLGLAPVVVGQLAELVREAARGGTTVVLVEQSVNVAL